MEVIKDCLCVALRDVAMGTVVGWVGIDVCERAGGGRDIQSMELHSRIQAVQGEWL